MAESIKSKNVSVPKNLCIYKKSMVKPLSIQEESTSILYD